MSRDDAVRTMLGGLPFSVLARGDVTYAAVSYEIEGKIRSVQNRPLGALLTTTIPIRELPAVFVDSQTKIYAAVEKPQNLATFSALQQDKTVRITFLYNIKKQIWRISRIIILPSSRTP